MSIITTPEQRFTEDAPRPLSAELSLDASPAEFAHTVLQLKSKRFKRALEFVVVIAPEFELEDDADNIGTRLIAQLDAVDRAQEIEGALSEAGFSARSIMAYSKRADMLMHSTLNALYPAGEA